MGFRRRYSITGLLFVMVLLIFVSTNWRIQEQFYAIYYYVTQHSKVVEDKDALKEVLKSFKQIEYKDIDKEYKSYTKSEQSKYQGMLANKSYYVIQRKDFFKKIVGPFSIRNFIAKDKYYKNCIKNGSDEYLWLISEELLYKLYDLMEALEESGHNQNGFSITNGHRHPKYNEDIGGASKSRHIQGEALDLHIGDINKSGKYEKEDKEIVLKMLEEQVIQSSGGIGRYPGTRAVHFDVRGYKARWDKQ